jgi:hypothetical protein
MNRSKLICASGIGVVICVALLLVGAPRAGGQEPEESAAKLTKRMRCGRGGWAAALCGRSTRTTMGRERIRFATTSQSGIYPPRH